MNTEFVRDVSRALMSGGPLHFWTEVGEYFDATVALLAAHSNLSGPAEVAER